MTWYRLLHYMLQVFGKDPPYSKGQKIGRCCIDSSRFKNLLLIYLYIKKSIKFTHKKKKNNFNSIYFLKKC